jgi:hypothetical protein
MDSTVKADLEHLRDEGHSLLERDDADIARLYPVWSGRLMAALALVDDAASRAVEYTHESDVRVKTRAALDLVDGLLNPT